MLNESKCRSCGAAIRWVVMVSGKRMPVDANPEKRIVVDAGGGRVVDTYASHFSTCPNADQHRKPRESSHD